MNIHDSAIHYLQKHLLPSFKEMNVDLHLTGCGLRILDFGSQAQGGLRAGIALSKLCMAGLSEVSLTVGGGNGTSRSGGDGSSPGSVHRQSICRLAHLNQ